MSEGRIDSVDKRCKRRAVGQFRGGRLEGVRPAADEEAAVALADDEAGRFGHGREFGGRVLDRDGEGALVNVASVGGIRGLPRQVPYVASKHALVGMTKTLAVDWAPDVRVNALAPGYVKTDLTEGVRENESIREDLLAEIPQDRFADPEEVATSAVYLASDAASYVTGEVHLADGGMAAN